MLYDCIFEPPGVAMETGLQTERCYGLCYMVRRGKANPVSQWPAQPLVCLAWCSRCCWCLAHIAVLTDCTWNLEHEGFLMASIAVLAGNARGADVCQWSLGILPLWRDNCEAGFALFLRDPSAGLKPVFWSRNSLENVPHIDFFHFHVLVPNLP